MRLAACFAYKSKGRCSLPGAFLRGAPVARSAGAPRALGWEEQPGLPLASVCYSFRDGPVRGKPPWLILNFGCAYASRFLFLDAARKKLCYPELYQREMVGSTIA